MSELIQTKEDLVSYLTTKQIASKEPQKQVNVSTKLRRLILTDELQGKFIHKGAVKKFGFKSIGGGVYTAFIEERNK